MMQASKVNCTCAETDPFEPGVFQRPGAEYICHDFTDIRVARATLRD